MKKALPTVALAAAASLVLASCADGGSHDPAADDNQINIVASTAIWGDIAESLTAEAGSGDSDKGPYKGPNKGTDGDTNGPHVKVTTILDNNRDDPHSYEASAKDLANLRTADIVVANGGGYDNWLTDQVRAEVPLITAVPVQEGHEQEHSGEHEHGGTNPHVWFSIATVNTFVEDLAEQINELKPELKVDPKKVEKKTEKFAERLHKLKPAKVVLTEPVAEGIVTQSSLEDVTPKGYAGAVAKEAEPSAADIAATQKLIEDGKVDILLTNEQSHSAASSTLISAAKEKDIPIVNINESPETDQDYFDYVDAVISDLEKAEK